VSTCNHDDGGNKSQYNNTYSTQLCMLKTKTVQVTKDDHPIRILVSVSIANLNSNHV
jgi:hypothetical protein